MMTTLGNGAAVQSQKVVWKRHTRLDGDPVVPWEQFDNCNNHIRRVYMQWRNGMIENPQLTLSLLEYDVHNVIRLKAAVVSKTSGQPCWTWQYMRW